MKIAITGATGYLAGNILKRLIKNTDVDEIAVIEHKRHVDFNSEKISYYSALSDSELRAAIHNSSFVIHFAALYKTRTDLETVEELVKSNILLTSQILAVSSEQDNCRVIIPTTFSMLSNTQELIPSTFYAATKAFAELSADNFNTNTTFLRLPDTFGSHDPRHKVIDLMLSSFFEKKELRLKKSKDFELNVISVEDLVNIVEHIIYLNNDTKIQKYDLFYPVNKITIGEIVNIIDKDNSFVSCPNERYSPEVVNQKYVLPGYSIKYPISERIKQEVKTRYLEDKNV